MAESFNARITDTNATNNNWKRSEMAKILIVYDSKTGNTEKMAMAIADGAETIKNTRIVVKKACQTETKDLLGADGIIMGSPTYYG